MPMPAAMAAFGSRILTVLAVDEDVAVVGLVEAVEDRHEGGFAGAVFADDAVNGALADLQVDVPVGVDEAEALVDALQFDCQFAHDDPLLRGFRADRPPGRSVLVLLLPPCLSSLIAG
jgi:hypothetical protein